MRQLANIPIWGVLVKAPVEKVREFLTPLGDVFSILTSDDWTAAFCMEPDNNDYDVVTAPLRFRGYVPIYQFDFSRHEDMTLRWDGERWSLLERNSAYVTPTSVLREVGIRPRFWDAAPSTVKSEPLQVREAIVVEGASVEQVRALAGDRWRIEPGPLGTIVYGPDTHDMRITFNESRFALWEHAAGRVLEVKFYPQLGDFAYRVMKGEECLGTFRPGQTQTWDGTPFLGSVDGETQPEAIVEKLGIPRSFLVRS
jgi:hypothetical protein